MRTFALKQQRQKQRPSWLLRPDAATSAPKAVQRQEANRFAHDFSRIPIDHEPAETVAPSGVREVLSSPGQPLDAATRASMEERFGHDLSHVRVHSGSAAAKSARELGAFAYTFGRDIAFAAGRFAPGTDAGQRLLGHELTHVLQQQTSGPRIQLAPDPKDDENKKKAAALEKEIRGLPILSTLDAAAKGNVDLIILKASTKPFGTAKGQRFYYLEKLKVALTTPTTVKGGSATDYGCSEDTKKENLKEVEAALEIEKVWGGFLADVEEDVVAGGTNKTKRLGQGGKTFYVDRTDARNIRVQVKVKLNGDAKEVGSIKKLEDAIERKSHTKGYTLDLVFVDTPGSDVFEFTVKFCQWANSGNWASGPTTLSHELHHALGLQDRYDYIESHAANTQMNVAMRLHWFVVQMGKTSGARDPFSKMATSSNPLLAEDICEVAFEPGPEREKCIVERKSLDPVGIPPP